MGMNSTSVVLIIYLHVSDDQHLIEHLHLEFDKKVHLMIIQNVILMIAFHGYLFPLFCSYVFPTSLVHGYEPNGTYRLCLQWNFCDLAMSYHASCRYLVDIYPNLKKNTLSNYVVYNFAWILAIVLFG